MAFDAYESWLGVLADHRPPTYYDLLGLALFESDPETIEQAAVQRMKKVRQHQIGTYGDLSQTILDELALASVILRDTGRRAEYDATLRARGDAPGSVAAAPEDEITGHAIECQAESDEQSLHEFGSLAVLGTTGNGDDCLRPAPKRRRSRWKNLVGSALFVGTHGAILWAFIALVLPWITDRSAPQPDMKHSDARPVPPIRKSLDGEAAKPPVPPNPMGQSGYQAAHVRNAPAAAQDAQPRRTYPQPPGKKKTTQANVVPATKAPPLVQRGLAWIPT